MSTNGSPWDSLVEAEALAAALGRSDLVVLDARSSLADPASCEAAYREAHIPGARFADLDRDLSDHTAPGGRHPWPRSDAFTRRLGAWGISPETQVVAYDAGNGALAAARAWFLLRALGHRPVAVLNGGWVRWLELGLPVESRLPAVVETTYRGEFDRTRVLDASDVQAHLANGGMLVDARARERFAGEVEPIDPRAGHVPGAVNRPYTDNLDGRLFKSTPILAQEFGTLLQGHPPADVAVMCGSGVTACHHLLAMAHAGMPGGKLYAGSWSGWLEDPARPVATGHGDA